MSRNTKDSPDPSTRLQLALTALAWTLCWDHRHEFARLVDTAHQGAGLMAGDCPHLATALTSAQLSYASSQATSEPLAAALMGAARAFAVVWAEEAQLADFRSQLDGFGS